MLDLTCRRGVLGFVLEKCGAPHTLGGESVRRMLQAELSHPGNPVEG
jgi:hypothetical protein